MRKNAKDNLKNAMSKLCNCNDHLNLAYTHANDSRNKTEIHAALESVANAIDSAKCTLNNYKD